MTSTVRHDRREGHLFRQGRRVPCDVVLNYRDEEIISVDIEDVDMAEMPPDGVYQLAVGSEKLGKWIYWRRLFGGWEKA